ncbi:hypothetical protein [Nocardioides cynanchi]|uniref:hypothetical protein n=1 Tax=Nocardioides cynanchi TaxID=2558918 RepID=UPI001245612D|nr:hypothetical protein [Nocardioides cynanchi]
MWRRTGSGFRLGTAVAAASVLALVLQSGGAVARSAAPTGGPGVARVFTPAHGTSVTSAFFGLHAPLLGTLFPVVNPAVVDLTTNNVYWPQLETSPGVFDFSTLDPMVAQAAANHAKPLLVLGVTPAFHSTTPGLSPAEAQPTVPDLTAWKAYVTAVATRYTDTIDYQIWPEPNVKNNFQGTPAEMATLVVAAAKIIHGIAPAATVVAPAMVLRLRSERVFMAAFFDPARNGGLSIGNYVDAAGVDPYPLMNGTPEDSIALVLNAQKVLAAEHVNLPLWNLEVNYFVPVGGVTPAAPPSDRTASSYVIRTYVLNAAAGVRRVYWLGWLRYFNLGISMVEADGVTPTAAGNAFTRVRAWLLGQHARGCAYDKVSGVYSCQFVRDGRTSWVYWTQLGSAHVRAPAGVRHVQTMYGVTTSTRRGDRIRVTNAPVWVHH